MKSGKILITGSHGLLGSFLTKHLVDTGYDVLCPDDRVENVEILEKHGSGHFDWVIHTAALTNVDLCEKDIKLCYDVNVSGTRNIAELAKRTNARLVYISTASVFSGMSGNYTEEDVPYPKNFYSFSKTLGEEIVRGFERSLIIRLNIIGVHPRGSRGKNFLEWLFDSVKGNKDIRLFTDAMVNPLSSNSISEIIGEIIKINPKEKVLHIGSRDVVSKADIGKMVIKRFKNYTGKVSYVSMDESSQVASRPKQIWLNTDHIQKSHNIVMPTVESEINKIFENVKDIN